MTLSIRRARHDESGIFTALTIRSKAHWGCDEFFMQAVRHELEFQPDKFQPGFHVYILEDRPEALGFCSLIPVNHETIELHDLFVEPGRIGKSYGKQLWSFAVNLARDLGHRKLVLTADPYAEPSTHAKVLSAPVKKARPLFRPQASRHGVLPGRSQFLSGVVTRLAFSLPKLSLSLSGQGKMRPKLGSFPAVMFWLSPVTPRPSRRADRLK